MVEILPYQPLHKQKLFVFRKHVFYPQQPIRLIMKKPPCIFQAPKGIWSYALKQ
jgi:hypothetical protein